MVNWETLKRAMDGSASDEKYQRYAPLMNAAMIAAECTTVDRAAIWLAQLGHESQGLNLFRELWGPTADQANYDNMMGNRPGEGFRFRGRGAIQLTGRAGYTAFSEWAHAKGYAPSPTFFVDNPDEVESERYAFLAAVHYWTVARPQINSLCDKRDFVGVTRVINGGTNGLADRTLRWNRCLALGDTILPTQIGGTVVSAEDQVKTELVGPGFEGWEILGRSKVDPRRFNTLVEALSEIRDALVEPRDSFVEGSTARLDVPTLVQCTDAAAYRTERDVAALSAQVSELANAVKSLVEKVGK